MFLPLISLVILLTAFGLFYWYETEVKDHSKGQG